MEKPFENVLLRLTNVELSSAFDAVGMMIRHRPEGSREPVNEAVLKKTYGRILRSRGVGEERAAVLEQCEIRFSLGVVNVREIERELDELVVGLDKEEDPIQTIAILTRRMRTRAEELKALKQALD